MIALMTCILSALMTCILSALYMSVGLVRMDIGSVHLVMELRRGCIMLPVILTI